MLHAEFVRAELPNCFPTNMDFFTWPEFWLIGIVNISSQWAATGKCATPTTHLIHQFDYLAATYKLFPLAESYIFLSERSRGFQYCSGKFFMLHFCERAVVCGHDEANK